MRSTFPFPPPLRPQHRFDSALWIVIATVAAIIVAAVLLARYY